MTTKIQYEVMAYEVEKLYQKDFPPGDPAINEHCEFIASFIRACGWDEHEYWERWCREEDKINPILPERNINLS